MRSKWTLVLLALCAFTCLFSTALAAGIKEEATCANASNQQNPCQFVRDNCLDDNFLISYMELYYCDWHTHNSLFFILVALWIGVMFYLLYTIADNHFTVALQGLSDFFSLSPDMAGLTFLAFGNGAPDFFTSLAGVENNTSLILSGSIGSGLFITCLVLGSVILAASDPIKPDDEIKESAKTDKARYVPPYPFFRNTLLYLVCLVFSFVICLVKEIHYSIPATMIAIFGVYLSASILYHLFQRRKRDKAVFCEEKFASSELTKRSASAETFDTRKTRFSTMSFVRNVCGFQEKNIFERIIFFVTLPITILLCLTIPPLDGDDFDPFISSLHNRKLMRWRAILNPWFSFLFILFIFKKVDVYINGVFPYYGIYLILASICSLFFFFTTSYHGKPKFFIIHILYGFSLCIVWMYATSNELVSALSSVGHIFGISETILGVTVMAWGNSFGDLVADVATSRVGYFETAYTATFSGPIQNVLLTIGITFLTAALHSPDKVFQVMGLQNDIFIGFGFLGFSFLLTTFLTIFVFKFRIPKNYGYCLLGIYLLYMPVAIMAGAGIFPGLNNN